MTVKLQGHTGGGLAAQGNHASYRIGSAYTYGIRQAQTMNSCTGCCLDELKQEWFIRPSGVLSTYADMKEMGCSQGYQFLQAMEYPVVILSQGLEQNIRNRKADVYAGYPAASNSSENIFGSGPAPNAETAFQPQVSDADDIGFFLKTHGWCAHFDLVNAEGIESAGDGNLVGGAEDDACRLGAFSQCRIVEKNVFTGAGPIHIT